MDKWYIVLLEGLALGIGLFWLGLLFGKDIEHNAAKQELKQLETRINHCENMWKLDKELFFPELCQTVCVEEFEKMSC